MILFLSTTKKRFNKIYWIWCVLPFLACSAGSQAPGSRTVRVGPVVLAQLTVANGLPNGKAVIQDRIKAVKKVGVYSNGLKEGQWEESYNDTLVRTVEYAKGLFHGKVVTYWANGNRAHSIDFVHGKRHGKEQRFYQDGDLMETVLLENGKRHGKFERWTRTDTLLYGGHLIGQFCEGAKCGTWIKFYLNNKICWQVEMINGHRTGEMKWWDRSGDLKEIWVYEKGELIEKRNME